MTLVYILKKGSQGELRRLDTRGRPHYLRHDGPEHVLCYAPTRSGKGVGLIVPTLLSWSESAVITGLKGELWELTPGWRKRHANNRMLRFERVNERWRALESPERNLHEERT